MQVPQLPCFSDPIISGEDGATPLHYAARYKPANVLKQSKSTLSPTNVTMGDHDE